MRSLFAIVVFTGLLAAASASGQDLTGDLRGLQGKWRASFADGSSVVYEIDGQALTMIIAKDEAFNPQRIAFTFTLDESQNPRNLDFSRTLPNGDKREANRCIYELHGDTFLIMGGQGTRPRPTKFISGEGKPDTTWIFKREK